MAKFNFVEIETEVVAFARQAQEKFLEGKVMKDDDAAALLHSFQDPGVVAMVVTHLVNDCIEVFEVSQTRSLTAIVADREARGQFAIQGMKAVNKKRDLCLGGQIR